MRQLETMMQKEMTRKEFIATLGFGLASIFGLSTIIKLVLGKGHNEHLATSGYGSHAYGGRSKLS